MLAQQSGGTGDHPPSNHHTGFYDHVNNLAYEVSGSQLLERNLETNLTKPVRLSAFKEATSGCLPEIPRFVSNWEDAATTSGAYVSPSGLYLVNSQAAEDVLIANVGYTQGVHFWEFYCPVSLYGISFGVSRKDGTAWKYEWFEFTSSTSRTVSFRLNLESHKLLAWVNKKVPVRTHCLQLAEGTWHPCIKLKGKGNPAIFNPFSTDPEGIASPYNPFNTTTISFQFPAIKPTSAEGSPAVNDLPLQIVSLNNNQLCLYTSAGLAKVFTRNERTRKFEFDTFEPPSDASSHIELAFNVNDINTVNIYLNKNGLKPLESDRLQGESIYFEASLREWVDFFKYVLTYLQNDQGPLTIAQILLQKLEALRPYMHLLKEQIQPGLYSAYNKLAEWRKPKDHRHFENYDFAFTTSLSDLTNHLPAVRIFNGKDSVVVTSFKNYVAIAANHAISLYNSEVALHKISEIPVDGHFKKGKELKAISELALNSLSDDGQGPRLFKILTNCMSSNKPLPKSQPKPDFIPHTKFMKILMEDFKFSQEEASEALIHTNNESVDEAVAYITLKNTKNQPTESNWICLTCTLMNVAGLEVCEACGTPRTIDCEVVFEQLEESPSDTKHEVEPPINKLSLLSTGNAQAPLLVAFKQDISVRVCLVGPHPEYLSRFLFKQEYGYVSFTSFEYCEKASDLELASIEYLDYFFGVYKNRRWMMLDETRSCESPTKDWRLVYCDKEPVMCSLSNEGILSKHQIKINFNDLYGEIPCIQVTDSIEEPYTAKGICTLDGHLTTEEVVKYQTQSKPKSGKQKLLLHLEYLGTVPDEIVAADVVEGKDDETPPNTTEVTTTDDKQVNDEYIPLLVQQGPPGCNMSYPICSILYPAAKGFLANYPYQVVFKHLHGKNLQVNSVIIERIGRHHNVKEVMEGLIWLSDHLNVAPSLRFKFKFAGDSKRVVVRLPPLPPRKYLCILPVFEEGSDPNLPFEIGFVGATFRKDIVPVGQHLAQTFLSKHPIHDFIALRQEGRVVDLAKETVQLTEGNFLKITTEFPSDKPYRLEVKKPFRLLHSEIVEELEETVTNVAESAESLIQKIGVSGSNFQEVVDHLAARDLDNLTQPQVLELVNKLVLHTNRSSDKHEHIAALLKKLRHGRHSSYVDSIILSHLTNASLKAIPSVDVLDYLLTLNLLSNSQVETLLAETLAEIRKERSPRYSDLRKNTKYSHLMLEPQCYSSFYSNEVEQTTAHNSEPIYSSERLPINFAIVKEKFLRSIMIDLDKQATVSHVLLCFEKSDLRAKMRIKVFRDDHELVYSTFYQDHCWLQLARNAYSKDMKKLFKDPLASGLNCLGIELNVKTRYLIVEISHTLLPVIGEQSEIDNLPFIEIIPEVFGQFEGEGAIIPHLARYFLVPNESTHHVSKVNINNFSSYDKLAVTHRSKEYHLYQSIKQGSDNAEADGEALRKLITKKIDEADWEGLLRMHKEAAKKPTGRIGLDYHYTLVMKILFKHLSTFSEATAEDLYKTLIATETGPVSIAALKAVLRHPKFYTRALPSLNDTLYDTYSQATLPEEEVRQYIKSLISSKNAAVNKKSTALLLKLLQSQSKPQEWLEEVALLGQETGHNEECGRILARSDWRNKAFAKKYLMVLANNQPDTFGKIATTLDAESLACHLIDMLKANNPESTAYASLLVPVVLTKITEIDKNSAVFEELAREVISNIQHSKEHDNTNEQLWAVLLQCSKQTLSQRTQLGVVELLLAQHSDVKLEYVDIAEVALKKHPEAVPNIIASKMLPHGLHYNMAAQAYVDLLLKAKAELEPGLQRYLTTELGAKLLQNCNVGGAEGAKCATEHQLGHFSWASKLLSLLIEGSKGKLMDNVKEDSLDGLIKWYLLNNTEELNPINPAYRTPSYDLLALIEGQLTSIFQSADKHASKLLKRIFEIFTSLNQQMKKASRILESTRHILTYRLHCGTNTLIRKLMDNRPELLSSFVCESHFFDSLVKTLKDEKPTSSEAPNIGTEQELCNKFVIHPSCEIKQEVKDWAVNKNGNAKAGLFNIPVGSPKLILSSPEPVKVSNIVVGYLAVDTAEKNNIYPASVSCWVGDSADSLVLLGHMDPIDDQNFSSSLTRVYGINLNCFKQVSADSKRDFSTQLNRSFKVIEFRMRKPNLASLADVFEGTQKSSDKAYYTLSFVSLNGYNEPANAPSFVETHLKLLSLLSQPTFKPTLDALIEKDFFRKHFNETVGIISRWISVPQYAKLINRLFTAISENSKELGNQIIDSFLRQGKRDALTAKLIGELITKNTSLAVERLRKFYHFLLEALKMVNSGNAHQYEPYFNVFVESLEVSALNVHKLNLPAIELVLLKEDTDTIEKLYVAVSEIRTSLVRFYTAVVIKREGVKGQDGVLFRHVQQVWERSNRTELYRLIAAAAPTCPEVVGWFLGKHLQSLIRQVIDDLNHNLPVLNAITLLNSLSSSPTINDEINRSTSQLLIFKALSDTRNETTLLKPLSRDAIAQFVSFFQQTCIDTAAEMQFTHMLKELLTDLPTKYSTEFIYDFFIPLVNSSKSVSLVLLPVERTTNRFIERPSVVIPHCPIHANLERLSVESKFPKCEVSKLPDVFRGVWSKVPKEQALENSFLARGYVLYAEDAASANHILLQMTSAGRVTTIINDKHEQHEMPEGFDSLRVGNYEFKGSDTDFTVSGLTEPKFEFYAVDDQAELELLTNELLMNMERPSVLDSNYVRKESAKNTLTHQHVYEVPVEMKVDDLIKEVNLAGLRLNKLALQHFSLRLKNGAVVESTQNLGDLFRANNQGGILYLEYDAEGLFQYSSISSILKPDYEAASELVPTVGLFRSFQKQGGVQKIIEVVIESVRIWKNQEVAKRWLQYVQELKSFSSFPYFFSLFMKNKENVELLFNLLVALPDKEDEKKWEPREKQSVKELYRIVSEVFVVDNSSKIREFAMSNNFFEMMLERLHLISKEPKRTLGQEEPEEQLPEAPVMTKQNSEQDVKKKKLEKKKGIGYGNDSSSNQKWDVAETELTKKQLNEQILNIIGILDRFLDFKNWVPPKRLLESIYQSALLPIIESALRGGSLLEIGKDSEVFKAYLRLIKTIARHESLIPCLLEIPPKYTPRQTDSVRSLLKQLEGTSKIFLSCLTVDTNEENKASEQVAKEIVSTSAVVDEAVEGYNEHKGEDTAELQRVLELPLNKKYQHFMKDLRFDYISMKDSSGKFKHHYSSSYSATYTPPVAKTIRLAQELADISTALPVEHTNAIYVRCDKERVDFMQALIMGSNGTPYGHGAYLFDIHFEDSYPTVSPKVNLTTTGHGKVRFNPNLYACGKVCLSLLGTWRGNATENWDPKVSTLLQVLVSIQSIIMAEEVYFNEPGFEHEQGTEQGERKNEAYSNIVRYCNIKYAMIENLRNPPKGFETVIRRHFYLKKDEILEECRKWVKYASKREASYNGLINDHNNNWCTEFKKSKTKYREMLEDAIRELEQELNKLPAPSPKDLIKNDKSPQKKKQAATRTGDLDSATQLNLEDVDVSYGTAPQKELELDFNDEKVKDRWSRYIGAMGIDAVSRQAKASVAVFGLGPFAMEVVKNIVLSGCRRITLIDDTAVTWKDLSGQFFFTEENIGKNRVDSCKYKIQELNNYVKVDRMPCDLSDLSRFKDYTVVFVTELPFADQIQLDKFCREHNIRFISADCYGPYARLFNDFGSEFIVVDKNGEDPTEVMIESITNAERGLVTLLQGSKHPYEDNDVVAISKVDGMAFLNDGEASSINGTVHAIKVVNSRSFLIGDTRNYSEYIKNGLAKNVKLPVKIAFPSFESAVLAKEDIPLDDNLSVADFTKISHNALLHYCYQALDQFRENKKALPGQWNNEDASTFVDLYKNADSGEFTPEKERFVRLFSYTCEGTFAPLCAFFGGYASQEIVKAITCKYKPTNCLFYCDFDEVLPTLPEDLAEWPAAVGTLHASAKNDRNAGLRIVVGDDLIKEIEKCRLFMIGSGAIGCELLKNYAMINLGVAPADPTNKTKQGMIVLTDPDHIEVSNLNRQFLFREKHIRKPKSSTAAASVIQMNPALKGHISARLERVSEATKDIFSDEFFRDLTIVTNALDNVVARRYVDLRCVQNKVPLLESGTLGPKGHVQVIIPYQTETYGSKEDPTEEGEIPHCTLKMFPEETLHCVEWARDKFGQKFSLKPKALIKILEAKSDDKEEGTDLKVLRSSLKLLERHPINFDGCVDYAVRKFYKYFRNDIKQLLYTYPLDAKTKDGQLFWKLPKRPPQPIEHFDPKDSLHCAFVTGLSVMLAKIYNIPYPPNFRSEEERHRIGEQAALIKVEPFVPSDEKAKQIAEQISKEKKSEEEENEEGDPNAPVDDEDGEEELLAKIDSLKLDLQPKISAEEFEKDCDENGHIDIIYAMANLRARNYSLDAMDWITTKLKAGRIVPALSTTTTAIAGLQTYQLVKYLKKVKLSEMRNAFINLAVPIMQLSEPGEVEKIKLTEDIVVTVWDRWEVKASKTLTISELFKLLEDKYKLKPRDLIYGSMPVYLAATMDLESKKEEKRTLINRPLRELLNLDEGAEYADVTVTFSKLEGGQLLKNTPSVRLLFVAEAESSKPDPVPAALEAPPLLAASASAGAHVQQQIIGDDAEVMDDASLDSIE